MMYAVSAQMLQRRGFVVPPAALSVALRSQAGRRAVRALSGLGDTDLSSLISSYANSFINSVGPSVEQGNPTSPDVVRQTLTSAVQNACADQAPGTPCDPSAVASQIDAAVTAYTLALQQKQASYYAAVANGQVVIPAGSTYVPPAPSGGGGTAGYVTPVTSNGVATSGGPTPTGGGQSTTPSATTVQVVFQNSSRPNQTLQVGDAWSLSITGPPNSPVSISGTKNTAPTSAAPAPFGTTDGNGSKLITGQMTANEIGSWTESIMVGNATPATISFSVLAAPSATGTTGGGGGTTTGSTTTTPTGTATPDATAAADTSTAFDSSTLLIIGAVAVGAWFLFSGSGGRR